MLTILLVLCVLNLILAVVMVIKALTTKTEGTDLRETLNRLMANFDSADKRQRDDMLTLRAELLGMETSTRKELMENLSRHSETATAENRGNREETLKALQRLNLQVNEDAAKNRTELNNSLNNLSESLNRKLQELTQAEQTQFETLKTSLDTRMEQIRTNNETKLEEMRKTVDEKLHETLEKRLGESFRQVTELLEQVHRGLGEMKGLANGVGDLKRVLSNVKTRGIMGEIQLEMLIEQMLSPEQYVKNFKPHKRRDDIVEFAVWLPGRDEDQEAVYLPIDAKFPIEDYNRLTEAWDTGDTVAVETARKALYNRIISCARDIRDKYINPPYTTDFALLFLPVEGLYAEILRDPDLFNLIQRQYQVVVVGPTTFAAILNALQMGFRTLAIEKSTGEVWRTLGAIKTEFSKFGEALEKTQKKLQEASNTIETASHRSRQIEKKLRKVQELPAEESMKLLDLEEGFEVRDADENEDAEDLT
jgi:DNA recombination protein RmuC